MSVAKAGCVGVVLLLLGLMALPKIVTNISPLPSENTDSRTAPTSAPVDRWAVTEGRNEMDGTPRVGVGLQADNEIKGFLKPYRPVLGIRCFGGRTEVLVQVGKPAEPEYGRDDHTVRLKFDGGSIRVERWTHSTDHQALFATNPVALARKLAKLRTFMVEFTPFQESPETITFTLDGLSDVLPKVCNACGWQL